MQSQPEAALAEIREARPQAPPALRHRVELISRLEPAPPRRLFTRRRLVLVLAAAALGAAIAAGVLTREAGDRSAGGGEAAAVESRELAPGGDERSLPAPVQGARLQDFRAELRVRVDDLPGATRQAMRIAQSLGGYVVTASYDGGSSDSVLVLSVPAGRAQAAIEQLSALGELAGQRFSLQDLQATVDQLDAQAERLQERIASLEQQVRNPALSQGERVALRARLDQAERELQDVLAQRDGTVQQGRSAEITLTLTSDPRVATTSADGLLDRALEAVRTVWTWVLAVIIVGAPFALVLAAALVAARRLRRRSDDRLLGG